MKTALRRAGQWFIVAFFCWHALSVALYSIPMATRDAAAQWLRFDVAQVFTPYLLATSQWQDWALFSPDPLRRVSRYRIEQLVGEEWQQIAEIGPGSYPRSRHATHFKFFIGLLEGEHTKPESVEHFVQSFCTDAMPKGTLLRLMYVQYIIDEPKTILHAFGPSPFEPRMIYTPSQTVPCS